MASWKCAVYGVVATLIIVLIILLNFDFLPKRKLSEELELAKKSSHKRPVTPTGIATLRTSTSTVEKVRRLKLIFHVCCGFLEQFTERFLVKIENMFPVLIIANLLNKFWKFLAVILLKQILDLSFANEIPGFCSLYEIRRMFPSLW